MTPFDVELLHLFLWVVGGLLAALTLIIGWIGNRIYGRLDSINTTLVNIDRDLRAEQSKTNSRVAVLENEVKGIFMQLKREVAQHVDL